jgi:alpha-beta hydrolase superfamily lysophospholipase
LIETFAIDLPSYFYHEILNDPEQDLVKADMIAWLDAHL